MATRDPALDTLLDLHGQTFFLDEEAKHWVKFEVKRVKPSAARPHGLSYSLTLHDDKGDRLVGFDNAHAVAQGSGPGAGRPPAHDHRHRLRTIQPYDYHDAASLLSDFWNVVEEVLKERGIAT